MTDKESEAFGSGVVCAIVVIAYTALIFVVGFLFGSGGSPW